MSHGPHKAAEPCGSYVGNVCTGFGAAATCMICGWDRLDHPETKERARRLFADALTAQRESASSSEAEPSSDGSYGPEAAK